MKMLPLSTCVLCPDLITVYALDRKAFILFFRSKLNKRSMHVVERRCRQRRAWRRLGGLCCLRRGKRWLLYWCSCGGSCIRALRWQLWPASHALRHGLKWCCLHGCTKAVGHRTSRWAHRRCAVDTIWGIGASIARTWLRTWGIRMIGETRTFKEMLFLTRGILCSDLLAVYTLYRKAFVVLWQNVSRFFRQQQPQQLTK